MGLSYFERLRRLSGERHSLLCVGLDPDPERIPGGASGALEHCRTVVKATEEHACCYKPNSAFWEQYGADGWKALLELRREAPKTPFLLDAKRADMANTMKAYARAIFETLGMDAVTAHAYHGADSLEEFARYADRGVYVVCRSSNPGAVDLQHKVLEDRPLFMHVAALAERVNKHQNMGLVVGATAPAEIMEVRSASKLPFLIPGVGAQGGDLEQSVRAAFNGDPASCLISSSRSILYADDPGRAASELKDQINSVVAALR
jgi:orotidine 5'-phosphate decarboxylase subfamily 2